jgi:two-component system, chemotaxis family, protein-glutamate methylesterase/glutaminase
MQQPDAIVIGASSGGVSALLELVSALPADLPAVVAVVLHVGRQDSILPELMTARGPIRAVHPADGDPLVPGVIYVAPPDFHMTFTPDVVRLVRGPRENHSRPAIDPLFRTAAVHWRERVIGVVLTGDLDDGTAGLAAIKACGGTAIVQDPDTAFQPSMPANALANVDVDACVPLGHDLPELLAKLAFAPKSTHPVADAVLHEVAVLRGKDVFENVHAVAKPSTLTCPDCGGSLWEMNETRLLRYRCHPGHAFTARSLENLQSQVTEHALWSSVRSLQEREVLLRRLATVSRATGDDHQASAGETEVLRLQTQITALIALIEEETSSA